MTPVKSSVTTLPSSSDNGPTPEMDQDTPVAVEPSTPSFPLLRKVFIAGIPEQLGRISAKANSQHQLLVHDNDSFESLLVSLDEEDQMSLVDEEESFYFTPLEEAPFLRMDRLKRELALRSELLEYLTRDQEPAYRAQLAQQEALVQQITLEAAKTKETERMKRRLERRRKNREAAAHPATSFENLGAEPPPVANITNAEVTPKSLFDDQSTSQLEQPRQHQIPAVPPFSYWDFEWYHARPALLSLVLSCVAHAAIYELVMAIVGFTIRPFIHYRVPWAGNEMILHSGHHSAEDWCHVVVLLVGLGLSRCSGLLYSFDETKKKTHENPQRFDRHWARWLYFDKRGRRIKSFLDVFGFYLCLVAVMYFMERFAHCFDQRSIVLSEMPSSRHNVGRSLWQSAARDVETSFGTCPAAVEDILPVCTSHNLDDYGNRIIRESKLEDEAYLYERLSVSAYQQFFGHGFGAAIFDLPHQTVYNVACFVAAIYALKRWFGCSFWDDW